VEGVVIRSRVVCILVLLFRPRRVRWFVSFGSVRDYVGMEDISTLCRAKTGIVVRRFQSLNVRRRSVGSVSRYSRRGRRACRKAGGSWTSRLPVVDGRAGCRVGEDRAGAEGRRQVPWEREREKARTDLGLMRLGRRLTTFVLFPTSSLRSVVARASRCGGEGQSAARDMGAVVRLGQVSSAQCGGEEEGVISWSTQWAEAEGKMPWTLKGAQVYEERQRPRSKFCGRIEMVW
jgi:hypothetical protein